MVLANRRLPEWCKRVIPRDPSKLVNTDRTISKYGLQTVCKNAVCPNRLECYDRGIATFLILGSVCTRGCRFCAIQSGVPGCVDRDEPHKVAGAVKELMLDYVVITSVTRDDFPDGGAGHFSETILAIRNAAPGCRIEVLIPDFSGKKEALETVLATKPDVLAHNIETVPRLYSTVRPGADFMRSLGLIRSASSSGKGSIIKSGLMLGLGEESCEVETVLQNLYECGCASITIGQYLQPSSAHLPVARFIEPVEFAQWEAYAKDQVGFDFVAAGPLIRSSYRAYEQLTH